MESLSDLNLLVDELVIQAEMNAHAVWMQNVGFDYLLIYHPIVRRMRNMNRALLLADYIGK